MRLGVRGRALLQEHAEPQRFGELLHFAGVVDDARDRRARRSRCRCRRRCRADRSGSSSAASAPVRSTSSSALTSASRSSRSSRKPSLTGSRRGCAYSSSSDLSERDGSAASRPELLRGSLATTNCGKCAAASTHAHAAGQDVVGDVVEVAADRRLEQRDRRSDRHRRDRAYGSRTDRCSGTRRCRRRRRHHRSRSRKEAAGSIGSTVIITGNAGSTVGQIGDCSSGV